jgi:hypothetical protein
VCLAARSVIGLVLHCNNSPHINNRRHIAIISPPPSLYQPHQINHGGNQTSPKSQFSIHTHTNPSLTQLGRLTHFAFDAVLVSAFLAGVKRSTGLTYVFFFPSTF